MVEAEMSEDGGWGELSDPDQEEEIYTSSNVEMTTPIESQAKDTQA